MLYFLLQLFLALFLNYPTFKQTFSIFKSGELYNLSDLIALNFLRLLIIQLRELIIGQVS